MGWFNHQLVTSGWWRAVRNQNNDNKRIEANVGRPVSFVCQTAELAFWIPWKPCENLVSAKRLNRKIVRSSTPSFQATQLGEISWPSSRIYQYQGSFPIWEESNNTNLWYFWGISLPTMHCLGWFYIMTPVYTRMIKKACLNELTSDHCFLGRVHSRFAFSWMVIGWIQSHLAGQLRVQMSGEHRHFILQERDCLNQ